MTTEAERLANELVGGYSEPTWHESEAAALLRSQAAEIERLTEADAYNTEIIRLGAEKIQRKDALLRRALASLEMADCSVGYCCCGSAMDAHTFGDGHSPVDQGVYVQSELVANIKTELGEQP
jgi:hypothetical protein